MVNRKNIWVTGCGRSGTGLLVILMGYFKHYNANTTSEISPEHMKKKIKNNNIIIKKPLYGKFLTEEPYFKILDSIFSKNFKIVYIMRDPRDVLTSHHYSKPNIYWESYPNPRCTSLARWTRGAKIAEAYKENPNFHIVKYEDIVTNPLMELDKIAFFANTTYDKNKVLEFYNDPTHKQNTQIPIYRALNGLREISDSNIGRCKLSEHSKRIKDIYNDSELMEWANKVGYNMRELEKDKND